MSTSFTALCHYRNERYGAAQHGRALCGMCGYVIKSAVAGIEGERGHEVALRRRRLAELYPADRVRL